MAQTPAIFHLPLAQRSAADAPGDAIADSEWRTPALCVQAAAELRAPIVWLGGCEPLSHPNIADVVSALVAKDRYVFLHTSGVGLRRRFHEFQPVPRFYMTVEIPSDSSGSANSLTSADSAASIQTVAECIRAARLSGFYVCGHFTIGEQTSPAHVAAHIEEFSKRGLDGLAISSRGVAPAAEFNSPPLARLDEFARLIPSLGWRSFSRLLAPSYRLPASPRDSAASASRAENACEESA